MTYRITPPQQLNAQITLPASKSISNRALIMHALATGNTLPENLSVCDDTDVMIRALQDMPYTIDIMAAGTAMRFMTAYLAATEGEHILTGTERMRHRPISVLVDALRNMGADIEYTEEVGYPPLHIRGKSLTGGKLDVPGSISSQYISALLMVAPIMQLGLELHLTGDIVSRPYIDLTLYMMKLYSADAAWTSEDTIVVKPQGYADTPFVIENDWSAASYWYEMMAMYEGRQHKIQFTGLYDGSKQGDAVVKYIYSLLGIKTVFDQKSTDGSTITTLSKRIGQVQRLDFDFINCPDLAQTVAVTCCALNIPFHFKGLASLKIKETDRIEALKRELHKVGYVLHSLNDSELTWDGTRCKASMSPIDTYDDHRMAMAFAPLCIVSGEIQINHPEVVTKSYPNFWDDMRQAGFEIASV